VIAQPPSGMSGLATAKSRKHRSASPGIMRGGALSSPEGALAASDPCVPRSSPVPVGLWQASRDFAAEESGRGGQGGPDRAHAPQARRPAPVKGRSKGVCVKYTVCAHHPPGPWRVGSPPERVWSRARSAGVEHVHCLTHAFKTHAKLILLRRGRRHPTCPRPLPHAAPEG